MRQIDQVATPGGPLRAADLNELHKEIKRGNQLSIEGGTLTQGPSGPTISVDKSQSFYAAITAQGIGGFHSWEERRMDLKGGWITPPSPRRGGWNGEAAKEMNGGTVSIGSIVRLESGGSYTSALGTKEKIWLFNGPSKPSQKIFLWPHKYIWTFYTDGSLQWTLAYKEYNYDNAYIGANAPFYSKNRVIIDNGVLWNSSGLFSQMPSNFNANYYSGPSFSAGASVSNLNLNNQNINELFWSTEYVLNYRQTAAATIWGLLTGRPIAINESQLYPHNSYYNTGILNANGTPVILPCYRLYNYNYEIREIYCSFVPFRPYFAGALRCDINGTAWPNPTASPYGSYVKLSLPVPNYNNMYNVLAADPFNLVDAKNTFWLEGQLDITGKYYITQTGHTNPPNYVAPVSTIGGGIGGGISGGSGTSGGTIVTPVV
jgi:hypothetical protein